MRGLYRDRSKRHYMFCDAERDRARVYSTHKLFAISICPFFDLIGFRSSFAFDSRNK